MYCNKIKVFRFRILFIGEKHDFKIDSLTYSRANDIPEPESAVQLPAAPRQQNNLVAQWHRVHFVVQIFLIALIGPSVIKDIDVIWWNSKRRVSALQHGPILLGVALALALAVFTQSGQPANLNVSCLLHVYFTL